MCKHLTITSTGLGSSDIILVSLDLRFMWQENVKAFWQLSNHLCWISTASPRKLPHCQNRINLYIYILKRRHVGSTGQIVYSSTNRPTYLFHFSSSCNFAKVSDLFDVGTVHDPSELGLSRYFLSLLMILVFSIILEDFDNILDFSCFIRLSYYVFCYPSDLLMHHSVSYYIFHYFSL